MDFLARSRPIALSASESRRRDAELLLCVYIRYILCRSSHREGRLLPIIDPSIVFLFRENMMGNSLHNKIPLGRGSVLRSRGVQVAVLLCAMLSIGAVWFLFRTVK
jgi:hypothetical protein